MTQPNFFLIGAPKCGTTSIARWLAKHAEIFISEIKEPHFFNTDMSHRTIKNKSNYEQLFESCDKERVVGEASVWYLYSKDAVKNIEKYCDIPPRYLVCIRNPVEMAHSLHEQQVFSGNENIKNFADAWGKNNLRRKGLLVPVGATDSSTLVYSDTCALGSQLSALLERVDRSRIHIVLMDDLACSPELEFEAIQKFLGLNIDASINLEIHNAAKARKSIIIQVVAKGLGSIKTKLRIRRSFGIASLLDAWNRKARPRESMPEDFRRNLIKHFDSEIEKIEAITGRSLLHWRDLDA